MSVQFQRHYFNVDDYYRMAEVGLLSAEQRVELIEGEIVEMSPVAARTPEPWIGRIHFLMGTLETL